MSVRARQILLALIGFLVALTGVAAAILFGVFPRHAAPSAKRIEVTPARLARGKYLFEVVADCDGCHSLRDFDRFGGPVLPHGRGAGNAFPSTMGLPGQIVAPNISSDRETGIGAWTDGEKIRAIREGISRDGRALFPMMPYEAYRRMSDDDVESLVAYLNALPPVHRALPRSQVQVPVSLFMRFAPEPVKTVVTGPVKTDRAAYGEYLTNIGGCRSCHTPSEKGKPIEGREFAGGELFRFPFAQVASANITPDPETGIGQWTEDYFVQRFALQRTYVEKGSPTVKPEQFTLMPWLGLSQMEESDLRAIYTYLHRQPAVSNKVDKHPPLVQTASF